MLFHMEGKVSFQWVKSNNMFMFLERFSTVSYALVLKSTKVTRVASKTDTERMLAKFPMEFDEPRYKVRGVSK